MSTDALDFNPFAFFHGIWIPDFLVSYPGISPAAKICYAQLCRYAGRKTNTCWPSQATLAKELGVSERSIGSYLKELEEDRFISIERMGLQQTNHYRLTRNALIDGILGGTVSDPDQKNPSDQDQKTSSDPTYRTEKSHRERIISEVQEQPLTFRELLHRWVRYKGLKKPPKPILIAAERMWTRTAIGETACNAALGDFHANGWWKTAENPLLAFTKNPLGWATSEPHGADDYSDIVGDGDEETDASERAPEPSAEISAPPKTDPAKMSDREREMRGNEISEYMGVCIATQELPEAEREEIRGKKAAEIYAARSVAS